MRFRPRPLTIAVLVAALSGFLFASVSTSDFVEHLDRQVHSIHCSFVPGLGTPDSKGSSGCHTTMMSPYSSVFRTSVWGGIPIALPAMSVFAFIFFWALYLALADKQEDPRPTGFLLAASLLPLVASIVMGALSFAKLGAACKLCIGIYVASIAVFIFSFMAFRRAKRSNTDRTNSHVAASGMTALSPAIGFMLGVVFVLVPVVVYAAAVPDYSSYVASCGTLDRTSDLYKVMVPIGQQHGGRETIEVLDPLCPACKAFESRLAASGLDAKVRRSALLFPLDNRCNWMIDSAVHPGACAVSEAVICAGSRADQVLEWAFEEQEHIRQSAATDPNAAARMISARFPDIGRCVGSPTARAKLNRSLRWAVSNNLPVLTPQLYVDGVKLCDEDTDLGMDYALTRLLESGTAGGSKGERR